MSAAPLSRRYLYGDYLQWAGDERWELIAGEAHLMSPAPSRLHQDVVGGIFAQARIQLAGQRCRAYVAPFDVRLPLGAEADDQIDTVVQPDVSVVCDPAKLDAAGCRGAPDWVVEVLSPATEVRDRYLKRDLYEQHGVRELWLVDPLEKQVEIYRWQVLRHRFAAPIVVPMKGLLPEVAVPGLTIDWDRVD